MRYVIAPLTKIMSDARYQYQLGSISRMKSCVVNLRTFAEFKSRLSSLSYDIFRVFMGYYLEAMIVMMSVASEIVVDAIEIQNERF